MSDMLVSLRRSYVELITSGIQLFLVLLGFELGSASAWLYCLALLAAISVFTWLSALSRLRAIRDTPTSKIASAAQGYVELTGRGEQFGDTPVLGKLSLLPCLWYRYQLECRTSDTEWKTEDSGQSEDSFLLRDESGVCIVDPEHAEITTSHRDHWQKGDYRYTEWKLLRHDPVYVIGEFATKSGALEFDSRAEVIALLTEWKKDKRQLYERFDLNKDGELDMDEWMLARRAAQRVVEESRREATLQPDMHLMHAPRDGKLFLISNLPPERLARRYLVWSWAHLVIFFCALACIGWVMQNGDF
jgi:hypothetical protein